MIEFVISAKEFANIDASLHGTNDRDRDRRWYLDLARSFEAMRIRERTIRLDGSRFRQPMAKARASIHKFSLLKHLRAQDMER